MRTEILYEDNSVLVIRKPAGLAVQSARIGQADVVSELKSYLAKQAGAGQGEPYLAVIHRLDQPVEGILVFGKTPEAAKSLSAQITAGKMEKIYLAVTYGKQAEAGKKEKVLEDYLKKDGKSNTSSVVNAHTPGAKKARLSYEVLGEAVDAISGKKKWLLRIHLDTGRHHQIRVQMAHAGMPLVGDRKYNPGQNSQEPLALCSAKLGFQHPVTKKQLEFQVQPAGMAFKRH